MKNSKPLIILASNDLNFQENIAALMGGHAKFKYLDKNSFKNMDMFLRVNHSNLLVFDDSIIDKAHLSKILSIKAAIKMNPVPVVFLMSTAMVKIAEKMFEDLNVHKIFLEKPARTQEIKEWSMQFLKINEDVNKKTSGNEDIDYSHENEFKNISIDIIKHNLEYDFDVYIRLNERKFVKYIKKETSSKSKEMLAKKLENKQGLTCVYVKKDEYRAFLNKSIDDKNDFLRKEKDNMKKSKKLLSVTSEIMSDIYFNEVEEELFVEGKNTVNETLNYIGKGNGKEKVTAITLLEMLNEFDPTLYKHTMGMAIYSSLILKKMGLDKRRGIPYKLNMAALMCDISLKNINESILKEILSGNKKWLEEDQMVEYRNHPAKSVELIEHLSVVDDDILQMVYQHHERMDGSGFPAKLSKNRIHPLAGILSLADEFCFQVFKTEYKPEPKDPKVVLNRLSWDSNLGFDKGYVKALRSYFVSEEEEKEENSKVG